MKTADTFEITIDQPPGRRLPKWARTALVQDGVVFIPAVTCNGDEQGAMLRARSDGEESITHANHSFLRLAWVNQAFPNVLWRSIEARLLEMTKDFA